MESPNIENQPEFYTLEELAEHLKVSVRTVMRLIDKCEIKAFKVGRQWRVSSVQLARYLKSVENGKS